MSRPIRIDEEVYAAVLAAKQEVERQTGRLASMSDGVRLLLERANGQ